MGSRAGTGSDGRRHRRAAPVALDALGGGDVMTDGRTTVVAQLAELVASFDRQETKTAAGLHELIDSGVRHVAGSQYAGITLAEKSKAVTNAVATHRYPTVLDAIQNRYGEGPCLAAAWRHHVMHVDDLNVDQRWPRYRRYALEQTPIRSIVSYELFVDGDGMAVLTFYADRPHAPATNQSSLAAFSPRTSRWRGR